MSTIQENAAGIFVRGIAVWLLIIAVETVHGVVRTLLIEPAIGDLRARQIGVLIGSMLIVAVSLVTVRWIGARNTEELIAIGVVWVVLTVTFEVTLGLFVAGLSMERILSDYDISRGGLMIFGLLIMLLAPVISAYFRGWSASDPN
ncbi:MAG: hypothetical protein AB7Q37_10085 [Pyrinomonadaceae bacterium]